MKAKIGDKKRFSMIKEKKSMIMIPFRFVVSFYLKLILPIVAYMAGGKLGLKFATLYGTYKLWPQNKKLESMLLDKFTNIEFEKDMMGGAIMIAAHK